MDRYFHYGTYVHNVVYNVSKMEIFYSFATAVTEEVGLL